MELRESIYIDGAWTAPGATGLLDVYGAATEEVIGAVPDGTAADVDRAVRAARAAFEGWARTPLDERLDLLARLEKAVTSRADELAALISTEVGTPIRLSSIVQVGLPRKVMRTYGSLLADLIDEGGWWAKPSPPTPTST